MKQGKERQLGNQDQHQQPKFVTADLPVCPQESLHQPQPRQQLLTEKPISNNLFTMNHAKQKIAEAFGLSLTTISNVFDQIQQNKQQEERAQRLKQQRIPRIAKSVDAKNAMTAFLQSNWVELGQEYTCSTQPFGQAFLVFQQQYDNRPPKPWSKFASVLYGRGIRQDLTQDVLRGIRCVKPNLASNPTVATVTTTITTSNTTSNTTAKTTPSTTTSTTASTSIPNSSSLSSFLSSIPLYRPPYLDSKRWMYRDVFADVLGDEPPEEIDRKHWYGLLSLG